MELSLLFLFWIQLVFNHIGTSSGAVHLTKSDLSRVILTANNNYVNRRYRRQAIVNPQKFPVHQAVLNVPLPTNIGFFPGYGKIVDKCNRDEIEMEDGTCQNLLTIGNCKYTEEVLLDPETKKGFCGKRLCPPDRVFVHATQMCHDPREQGICPPGRELYYSAHGTSVCSCPDGTVEGDDDLDDDVCELVLGKSLLCLPTQVFWFKNFNSPPECLPDPCYGKNLKKLPTELPFVPSKTTGKCYQIGQSKPACPYNQYYALALDDLAGECVTLEDAGYNIYDNHTIEVLREIYGSRFLSRNESSAIANGSNQQMYGNMQGSPDQLNQQINGNQAYGNQHLSTNQPGYGNQHVTTNQPSNGNQQVPTNQPSYGNQHVSTNQPSNGNQQIPTNQPSYGNQHVSTNQPSNGNQQVPINQPSYGNQHVSTNQPSNGNQHVSTNQPSNGNQPSNQQILNNDGNNNNYISNNQQTSELRSTINYNERHRFSSNIQHQPSLNQQSNMYSSNKEFGTKIQNKYSGNQSKNLKNKLHKNVNQAENSNQYSTIPSQIEFNQNGLQANYQRNRNTGISQSNDNIQQHNNRNRVSHTKVSQQNNFNEHHNLHQTNNNFDHQYQNRINQNHIQSNQQQSVQGQNQYSTGNNQTPGHHLEPISVELFNNGHHNQHNQGRPGHYQEPISIEEFNNGYQNQGGRVNHHNGGPSHYQEPISVEFYGGNNSFNSPEVFGPEGHQSIEHVTRNIPYGVRFIRSLGFLQPPNSAILKVHITVLASGDIIGHKVPNRHKRNVLAEEDNKSIYSDSTKVETKILSRKKRTVFAFASPSNVFETRLLGCRAGAARDINGKCRTTILPSRIPKRRGTRSAPPVRPTPMCPRGMAFNIRRQCVPSGRAQNALTAFNLG